MNTASYSTSGVAPGSIVSIFGSNLASQPVTASSVPLPTTLGNVISVTFDSVPAPLYFVSSGQINAQVPWEVLAAGSTSGSANVVVTTSAGSSSPQTVQVAPALPGIFTTSANGAGQAIATDNADGVIAAPAGAINILTTHPIQIGSYLIIWCTGLGAVDSDIPDGANTGGAIVNTLVHANRIDWRRRRDFGLFGALAAIRRRVSGCRTGAARHAYRERRAIADPDERRHHS